MQGAKSRVWPDPAGALASTKLMSPKQARDAVERADAAPLPRTGAAAS